MIILILKILHPRCRLSYLFLQFLVGVINHFDSLFQLDNLLVFIIAGFYKVGMFPYETLPFLIKTDTAGRVVWQDAGLGDFPAGAAEPKAVTEHLVFYPNPAQDVLNYTVKTDGFDELEIVIYDLLGKEVIRTTANGHECAINMLNLPNGLYLVTYMMQVGSTVINGTQKLMITN